MGYNTVVVVLNDALQQIATDQDFGKKLVDAISATLTRGGNIDVSAGNHINAATVVTSHHADFTSVITVGGNCGSILGSLYNQGRHTTDEDKLKILKSIADDMGYTLRKKPEDNREQNERINLLPKKLKESKN